MAARGSVLLFVAGLAHGAGAHSITDTIGELAQLLSRDVSSAEVIAHVGPVTSNTRHLPAMKLEPRLEGVSGARLTRNGEQLELTLWLEPEHRPTLAVLHDRLGDYYVEPGLGPGSDGLLPPRSRQALGQRISLRVAPRLVRLALFASRLVVATVRCSPIRLPLVILGSRAIHVGATGTHPHQRERHQRTLQHTSPSSDPQVTPSGSSGIG